MKTKHGNIFLVGLMGSGKTTVGRQLARMLDKQFFDSDHEIEARTGVRITDIFDIEGEAGFRVREKNMIAELSQHRNIILATGGGAILDPDNRAQLQNNGTIVYLHGKVADLLRRTQYDRNRPLLQNDHRQATLEHLFLVRDPIYREIADLIVDTSARDCSHLAQDILQKLSQLTQ